MKLMELNINIYFPNLTIKLLKNYIQSVTENLEMSTIE